MVLGRKTNFLLGKRWFWLKYKLFLWKKMVLGRKTNFLLLGKKMVLGRKTNFLLGKRWFWLKYQLFLWKKMVLGRKTNFFRGKDGFGVKNELFPRKKMVLGYVRYKTRVGSSWAGGFTIYIYICTFMNACLPTFLPSFLPPGFLPWLSGRAIAPTCNHIIYICTCLHLYTCTYAWPVLSNTTEW